MVRNRVAEILVTHRNAMRKTIWSAALMALATLAHAAVSVAPVLVSDDFETGNAPNAVPAGWKIAAG